MATDVFADLKISSPELAAPYLSGRETIVQAFYDMVADLPKAQRTALLLHFTASVPVPLFYQELAVLVRAGFFTRIVTTNVDTLFERALDGAGLRRDRNYRVVMVDGGEAGSGNGGNSEAGITLVKLHGDLSQQQFAITPEEVIEGLEPRRRFVKGQLRHDLVMVGYEFESPPLTESLAWVPGELWWVSPERPERDVMRKIEDARKVTYVDGPSAAPDVVFGELALLLLQMPAMNAMKPLESLGQRKMVPSDLSDEPDVSPPDDAEAFEREYLVGQLRRSEDLLRKLELQAAPGDTNQRLERQIEYQKQEIASLEAKLRNLAGVRDHILTLLDEIDEAAVATKTHAASEGTDDADAVALLQRQIDTVRAEYATAEPNEHVVSAMLGATMILGDRLRVRPDLLRELGHFTGRTTVRGAW